MHTRVMSLCILTSDEVRICSCRYFFVCLLSKISRWLLPLLKFNTEVDKLNRLDCEMTQQQIGIYILWTINDWKLSFYFPPNCTIEHDTFKIIYVKK